MKAGIFGIFNIKKGQNTVFLPVLASFSKWIDKTDADDMQWENSGFSLNGSVRIDAWDRESTLNLLSGIVCLWLIDCGVTNLD